MSKLPRRLDQLAPADYNPRVISEATRQELGRTMKRFGDLGGIVYNLRTGRLIGGHQRTANMPKNLVLRYPRGEDPDEHGNIWAEVTHQEQTWPVRVVDWPEQKEKAANLAANAIWLQGDTDAEAFAEVLKDVDLSDVELSPLEVEQMLTGHVEDDVLEAILGRPAAADEAQEPEVVQEDLDALQAVREAGDAQRGVVDNYRDTAAGGRIRREMQKQDKGDCWVAVVFQDEERVAQFKQALGYPANQRYIDGEYMLKILFPEEGRDDT